MSYDDVLRRVSAILLLALIGLSLMVPAFGADAVTNLPACCRRAGKHHCSMPADKSTSRPESGFRANGRCSLYPPVMLPQGAPVLWEIPSLNSACVQNSSFELATLCERVRAGILPARANPKRGPPSFSLLG